MAQDSVTGEVLAGVGNMKIISLGLFMTISKSLKPGIYFLHEYGYGIYVANIVPNSAASHCGIIANGDFLVQVDNEQLTAQTSLEQVCPWHSEKNWDFAKSLFKR